jgi:hypothetical protein
MASLKDFLANTAGWTLHDDRMSQSSFFVAKSAGESGKEDIYVQFADDSTTNLVSVKPVLYWDAAGHAGVKEAFSSGNTGFITRDASQFLYWFFADLDHIFVVTKISSTYYGMYTGVLRRFWSGEIAVTQAYADVGSSVVVSVDDASVLIPGRSYIIKDNAGIERVTVNAANVQATPNTATIAALARGYAAGAKIGEDPQPVVVWKPSYSGLPGTTSPFYALNQYNGYASATGQSGYVYSLGRDLAGCSDHDSRYNLVSIFPFVAAQSGTVKDVRGELIEVFAVGSSAGLSEDVIEIGSLTYKIFNIDSLGWCAVRE